MQITPDLILPAKVVQGFAIYGWFRYDQYLYIGKSISVIRRLKSHHAINKKEPLALKDEIHVWYCCESELRRLEGQLIRHFNPPFNKHIPIEKVKDKKPVISPKTKFNRPFRRGMTEDDLKRIEEKYGYKLP